MGQHLTIFSWSDCSASILALRLRKATIEAQKPCRTQCLPHQGPFKAPCKDCLPSNANDASPAALSSRSSFGLSSHECQFSPGSRLHRSEPNSRLSSKRRVGIAQGYEKIFVSDSLLSSLGSFEPKMRTKVLTSRAALLMEGSHLVCGHMWWIGVVL